MPALAGVTRREQVRAGSSLHARSGPGAASRPSGGAAPGQPPQVERPTSRPSVVLGAVASQPVDGADGVPQRMVLRLNNIVQRVFDTSPLMRASREEMTAAEYALQEFRANLSRFEPYVNTRGDTAAYPERRDARGSSGEIVGGIQKETFEGAVLRLEGGASMSAFEYRDAEEADDRIDRGSGGLVRARVEVPFIGSRKRQERVISQAFQESQARRARLEYLSDFRIHATNALEYYLLATLQEDYAQAYEQQAESIETLLDDARLKEPDRMRLTSSMESSRVTRDQYLTSKRTYGLLLLALLGYPMDTPFQLEPRPEAESPYLDALATPDGVATMLEQAYANNPRFRVLQDAIRDAELQRQQAILGKYDVTAFFEGTQFPFGATTYDDRLGGWLLAGGVNVRLNDQRVLTASRMKAEAQIRQFQAEIEAERLSIERKIIDNSGQLASYHRIREEGHQVARKKESEYRLRSSVYFEGSDPSLTIDNVLGPLAEWTTAEIRLAANKYYIGLANLAIMTATGELYAMVGMNVDDIGTPGATERSTAPEQEQQPK